MPQKTIFKMPKVGNLGAKVYLNNANDIFLVAYFSLQQNLILLECPNVETAPQNANRN